MARPVVIRWILFILLISVFVVLIFVGYKKFEKSTQAHFLVKVLKPILIPDGASVGEAFVLEEVAHKKPLIIFSEFFYRDRNRAGRVRLLEENQENEFIDVTAERIQGPVALAYHMRHLLYVDVNNDGLKHILIADHGPDIPPFPGGRPLLLMQQQDHTFLNETDRRIPPDIRDFTFHVATLDVNGDGFLDIYLSSLGPKTSRPRILINNKEGFFRDESDRLPPEIRSGEICSMATATVDLDGDKLSELLVGGCDSDKNNATQAHDRVLMVKSGHLELLPLHFFPSRNEDDSWGTVSLQVLPNLKPEGKWPPSLVAVTHNYGFTQAEVIIYEPEFPMGGPRQNFRKTKPLWHSNPEVSGFIAWPTILEWTQNKRDILLPLRLINSTKQLPLLTWLRATDSEHSFSPLPNDVLKEFGSNGGHILRYGVSGGGPAALPIGRPVALQIDFSGQMKILTEIDF